MAHNGDVSVSVDELLKLKTSGCAPCKQIMKKSENNPTTKNGACRALWQDMKRRMAQAGGCVVCGETNPAVLEADHIIARVNGGAKKEKLSNESWWACNGGPEAMEEEFKLCQCLCVHHHKLKSHRERPTPPDYRTMPATTRTEKQARRVRMYRQLKHDHVDKIKLRIGKCCKCARKVTEENLQGFEFAHIDERTKLYKKGKSYGIALMCGSCVSNMIEIPLIDAEIEKCTLQCSNCHKLETDSRRIVA